MARNEAAKRRQGTRVVNGRVKPTRSASESGRGQYGNSKPKDDHSVKRARMLETSERHQRAAEELAKAEEKLRALEAAKAAESAALLAQPQTAEPVEEPVAVSARALIGGSQKAIEAEQLAEVHHIRAEEPDAEIHTLHTHPDVDETEILSAAPTWDLTAARTLIMDGYHIARVVERTGWGVEFLSDLVAEDGYIK